jgi:hypothetical protein
MSTVKEIVAWIFHVPSEYEMLWWVLAAVMWYGFSIERKLMALRQQLDDLAERPSHHRTEVEVGADAPLKTGRG